MISDNSRTTNIKNESTGRFESKYSPEFAEKIVEFMAQGYTLTAASGYFRVHKQTLYDWMEVHPEFKAACDIAQNARQHFFEKELIETKNPPRVTAAIFALKTHKNGEFKENVAVEHSGPEGKPIEHEITGITWNVVDHRPKENSESE